MTLYYYHASRGWESYDSLPRDALFIGYKNITNLCLAIPVETNSYKFNLKNLMLRATNSSLYASADGIINILFYDENRNLITEKNINLTNKTTPINNRKCKEFATYYERIWKEIDQHV